MKIKCSYKRLYTYFKHIKCIAYFNIILIYCFFSFGSLTFAQSSGTQMFVYGSPQYYNVCKNSVSNNIDTLLSAYDADPFFTYFYYGILTWSLQTAPAHGTISITSFSTIYNDTTAPSGVIIPIGFSYTPNLGYVGTDTFSIKVIDTMTPPNIDSTQFFVTVSPTPSIIVGSSTICLGGTATFFDSTSGGTWSVDNTSVATIDPSLGVLTILSTGIVNISYSVSCGASVSKTVNIINSSGTITGPTTLCVGNSITFLDSTPGGTWSTSNTNATINSSGLLNAISSGNVIITYSTGCGANAILPITINPLPAVGSIIGANSICIGSNSTFSDSMTGGIWSISNTSIATISSSGVVNGISGGSDTVTYSYSNSCGSISTTKVVTINPLPVVLPITGSSTVCQSVSITLSESTPGGTWNSSNTTIASVSGFGTIIANLPGLDTISYSLSNSCGTTIVLFTITVNPAPNAGYIYGAEGVCSSGSLTLINAISGGTWYSSNTLLATVLGGVVSGITNGIDTINYSFTNSCGTSIAKHLLMVSSNPIISTIAGTGSGGFNQDGIRGDSSKLNYPFGIAIDASGNTYIADLHNNRIRKISPSGIISTIAGNGSFGFSGDDGPATNATIHNAMCVAVDGSGNVYFSDALNNRIRKVNTSGIITTVAGNGTAGYSGDGVAATSAALNQPVGIALDASNNIIIADYSNNRIRKVNAAGYISTIAGTGTAGYTGNGFAATSATLNLPIGVATDNLGNIFIADNGNNTVRKINNLGIISTIAGNASGGFTADGIAATSSSLNAPTGVAVDGIGNIYVADQSNNRIRKISSGIISTIAGTGLYGFAGDGGSATAAQLYSPTGVQVSNIGNVYISDAANNVVRLVSPVCGCSGSPVAGNINATVSSGCSPYSTILSLSGSTSLPGISYQWQSSTDNISYTAIPGATLSTYNATISSPLYFNCVITCTNSSSSSITSSFYLDEGLPAISAITGLSTVCVGSTITLSDSTSGGAWTSTNAASVSSSGVVTGLINGIDTISFTKTNACGVNSTTHIITVLPLPVSGAITGATSLCLSSTYILNDTVIGGVWSSSNTSVANISGIGSLSLLSTGTSTISYTVSNSCGTAYSTAIITVYTTPIAGTITGISTLCNGTNVTLSDASTGGVWNSLNPGVAAVSPSGVVNGSSTGSTIISYTVTNPCGIVAATMPITVSPLPDAGTISGTLTVCQGFNTTLSNTSTGGIWSSGNTSIASILSGSIFSGISPGTSIILYTVTNSCGTATSSAVITVNPIPLSGTISGSTTLCEGSSTTLSETSTGGTWNSTNTGVATMSSLGILTAVSAGTTTISYTVSNSCGTVFATTLVTVNPLPNSGTITGASTICVGNTTSFIDAAGTGTWSSTNTSVATISSIGVLTGISQGASLISYTVNNSCGTSVANLLVTVNPLPDAGFITGLNTLCAGSTTTLSNTVSVGSWSSANTTIATINSFGEVLAISAGTTTISYTATNSCGTAVAAWFITINPIPVSGTILGSDMVCMGNLDTLTDIVLGGIWSSSNTSVATISSSGVVSTITLGASIISYSVTNSCGTSIATKTITINPLPTAGTISGLNTVCQFSTITLSETVTDGVWSSANSGIAPVSANVVIGFSAGTTLISYTVINGCGTAVALYSVTVNPFPLSGTITGNNIICAGSLDTLLDTYFGGNWTSSNTSVATISDSGIVTAVSAGTSTINYVANNSCGTSIATKIITVNPLPFAGTITGTNVVCATLFTTLTDAALGGIWSSTNTAVATVVGGVVNGLSAGTTTIEYAVTNSCGTIVASTLLTVNPIPVAGTILGYNSLCSGSLDTLHDYATSGIWSSSNTIVASISPFGIVFGGTPGIATISYSVSNSCGLAVASMLISINPLPNSGGITGTAYLCNLATTTLTDTTSGGVWSSTNTGVATITAGIVTAISTGTSLISYTVINSCGISVANTIITVNPLPFADTISGTNAICNGSISTLTDASSGGTWSSLNTSIASITSGGVITAFAVGTTIISYTVSNSCGTVASTKTITILPLPFAGNIQGTFSLCQSAVVTLHDTIASGTWVSSNTSVATINTAGILTGINSGNSTISYLITNSCGTAIATKVVTVYPLPNAGIITGADSVCIGSSTTLSDLTIGGIWSSINTKATVIGGVVIGNIGGIDTIIYTSTNSCGTLSTSHIIYINPYSGLITGSDVVCAGSNITLTDIVTGGIWSCSNTLASVSGGIVSTVSSGTVTISYSITNSCGTAVSLFPITISPVPNSGTITGPTEVCVGSSITLSDLVTGGTWHSSNPSASVVFGNVTGLIAGTDTISYSITNSCGTANSVFPIIVKPLPFAGTIVGSPIVCTGNTITLTDLALGGSWVNFDTLLAPSTGGIVYGAHIGVDTILYVVTNTCGSDTATQILSINLSPHISSISGASIFCAGTSILLTDTTTAGVWACSNSTATVDTGLVTAISAGIDTVYYIFTNSCGSDTASHIVSINPLPNAGTISGPTTVCIGATTTLFNSATGGSWGSSNSLANVTLGIVTGVSIGIDSITYSDTNSCGTAQSFYVITINPLPNAGAIIGDSTVCATFSITLNDAASGGIWSCSNTNASVSGGIVTGNASGFDSIIYKITNTCGVAIATHTITINPLPDAGSITGVSIVCTGVTITLTDLITSGTWQLSNSSLSNIGGGIFTGVSQGIDTVNYVVTNMCGSATSTAIITVNPAPNAGIIVGQDSVCAGNTITLTDLSTGGTWESSNNSLAVVSGGIVISLTAGIDTIFYSVTNSCGTAKTSHVVNIQTYPNTQISGITFVCVGGKTDTLHGSPAGGNWSSVNTNATVSSGTFGGIVAAISPGLDTIIYLVSNNCGTKEFKLPITVFAADQCPTIVNSISNQITNSIIVYPNPSSDGAFTILLPEIGTNSNITIIDLYGKIIENKLFNTINNNKIQLDLNTLAKGTYLLKVTLNNNVYRDKIIIW